MLVPGSSQVFNIYGPPQTPELVGAAYDYTRIPYGVFAAEPIGRSALVDPFKTYVINRDGLVYQHDKIRVTAAEIHKLPVPIVAANKSAVAS